MRQDRKLLWRLQAAFGAKLLAGNGQTFRGKSPGTLSSCTSLRRRCDMELPGLVLVLCCQPEATVSSQIDCELTNRL